MNDRTYRQPSPGREYGRDYSQDRDYRSSPDYGYSSARDYAASGEDMDRRPARPSGGRRYPTQGEYRGSYWSDGHRTTDHEESYDQRPAPRDQRDYDRDRGFFDRAGDEVRSWFGDDEAERRREMDRRYDERRAAMEDDHYRSWRSERIAELDRDYDEYRREHRDRFHREFNNWRTDRQGQRDGLNRVGEHMEVVGSDGEHVGTVDKVRGDRILLTKTDKDAGGHHHSIPSRWIESVDEKVKIRKTAEEAQSLWRDEERSGMLFQGSDEDRTDSQLRSRNFSGPLV